MVRHYLICLVFMACSTPLTAQAEFSVALYKNSHATSELGKPVWLELRTDILSPRLRDIELSALRTRFFVDSTAEVTTTNNQQRWLLRLYPYQPGKQIIPRLSFNRSLSDPLTISITEPIDPKSGRQITVFTSHTPHTSESVWVRQQLAVSYGFHTDTRYSQFRFLPAAVDVAGMKNFILPPRQLDTQIYLYELGWIIHPTKQGTTRYELPPVQYLSDGVATHTFYHPPLQLTVQSLPLYVPATMPVGRLSVQNNDWWLFSFTQSLSEWRFTLRGEDITANAMPDLDAAIVSTADLRSYPANIDQTENFTVSGMMTENNYRIPFKVTAQGIKAFTPVKLDYFDPRTGRIHSLTLRPPYILSLRIWLAFVLALLIVLIIYRVFKQPVKSLYRRLQRYRLYRQTIQKMQFTTDANELRQCLRQLAKASGLSDNVSINSWLRSITSAPETETTVLAANINDFFFNRASAVRLSALRQDIQHFCRQYQRI